MRKINFLIGLSVALFSSCAYRANFVVQNNTTKPVIIELVCDSAYIPGLILEHQIRKYNYKRTAANFDSLKQSLKNPETLVKYLKDSLLMMDLLETNPGDIVKTLGIGIDSKIDYDWDQSISSYYKSDPALISRMANTNTITLFLPANYTFYNRCHACGDCSCDVDETFPFFAKEMKIKIDNKDLIMLTPDNFMHIMKKQTFNSMKECIVLELH